MPTSIQLQERDLDMLHSLGEARFLMAQGLEWLHYPNWRQRYRAIYEQQMQGQLVQYRPTANLYRRLAGLQQLGLARIIARRPDRARSSIGQLPAIYALTSRGALLLARERRLDLTTLAVAPEHRRAVQNLEHSLGIGTVYAALRTATTYRQQANLASWQGDHQLAAPQAYDRVPVVGSREPLPVQPDGAAVLTTTNQSVRLFIEYDRGTRPLNTWHTKLAAYHSYSGSAALRTRYGTETFLLLIIAPTQQRLLRIAEAIAQRTRQPDPRYLLLLDEHVHPTTIRSYWNQIDQIHWTVQRLPQGLHERPRVQLRNAALW